MAEVRITGLEELKRKIAAVENFDPGPPLERAAERLRDEIDPDVPRDSGDLARSARVEPYEDGAVLQHGGGDLDYGAIVDARTGYFTPRAEERGPQLASEECHLALEEDVEKA